MCGNDSLTQACCDPILSWDSFGNLFLVYLNDAADTTVLVNSTDGGQTFTQVQTWAAMDQPKVATGAGSVWVVFNNSNQRVQSFEYSRKKEAEEYAAILKRIENAEERLVVRLLHDTGLRPSDIVNLRLADLATEEGVTLIRRRTQKTGTICESVVTMETAEELAEYVKKSGVTDYVFRGETDKPHRHRTWPNAVLRFLKIVPVPSVALVAPAQITAAPSAP